MTPILYRSDETLFTSNGLGRLDECLRCIVTEERNGIFECEFDYPVNGRMYPEIIIGRIVGATHDDTGDIQPFDIYATSEPIDGVVTFYAHHISYRLSNVILTPFSASTCASALAGMKTHTMNPNPFAFWTDKSVSAHFAVDVPASVRSMLGGTAGSILDVYGKGEYRFDKFDVRLYTNRGSNNGVSIRYGLNMSDFRRDVNTSGSYSAVAPYWKSSEGGTIITLPELFIAAAEAPTTVVPWTDENGTEITDHDGTLLEFNHADIRLIPLDLSNDFTEQPTVDQLRALATKRLNNSGAWIPDENINIDFVQLWQTEEYENVAALQRVALCDRVNVYFSALGLSAMNIEVIKIVYNVLLDRYDKMELGEPSTSFADIIRENVATLVNTNYPTKSALDAAIDHATQLIAGNLGGYVVMNLNADGQPEELLIMDTPDIATAVNVWRFNKNGLGHSHSGYNGPFNDIALTADGKINASMITAGALNASLIQAGIITDGSGVNSWDIISGILTTRQGYIGDFRIKNGEIIYQRGGYGNVLSAFSKDGMRFAYQYSNALFEARVVGQGIDFYLDGERVFSIVQTRFTSENGVPHLTIGVPSGDYGYKGLMRFLLPGVDAADYLIDVVELLRILNGIQTPTNGIVPIYGGTALAPVQVGTILTNTSNNTSWDITVGFALCGPSGSRKLHVSNDGVKIWTKLNVATDAAVAGSLTVSGTKSRATQTDHYDNRLLYCYETPTPLFGDVGEGVIAEDGNCYVWIDPILAETISTAQYQVFLQAYGDGKCYVSERKPGYFVVSGAPGLSFGWEIKAKQREFAQRRLEVNNQIPVIQQPDYAAMAEDYVTEALSDSDRRDKL